MAFELKAYDSDITVKRIDLLSNLRPSKDLSYVSLYDGSNALAGVNASSFERLTTGDYLGDYKYRFDGLNLKVVKGATKTVTVKVTTLVSVTDEDYTFVIPEDGIRYTDTAGLPGYIPTADSDRDFDVVAVEGGELKLSLNADSPEEGIVVVSDAGTTTDVSLLAFDLQAKVTAVTVNTIQVDLTASSSVDATVEDIVYAAYLYSGSTLIASASIDDEDVCAGDAEYCAIFEDLDEDVVIAKNAKKTLTVKVTFAELNVETENYAENDFVSATVVSGNDDIIQADDVNYDPVVADAITGAADGEDMYLYLAAPVISSISVQLTETKEVVEGNTTTDTAWMSGTISFRLTAVGGDIIINADGITLAGVNSSNADNDVDLGETDQIKIDGKILGADTTEVIDRTITEGQYKTIVAKADIVASGGAAGSAEYVYLTVDAIEWADEDEEDEGALPDTLIENLVTDDLIFRTAE